MESGTESKKVLVETWGCQMNVADSEAMLSQLHKLNYTLTTNENEADLVVLNTCHIREKAKHKVLSRLGKLREIERKPTIAVTGCVAQAEGKKLLKEAPNIDILIGPGKIHELGRLLTNEGDKIALGFDRHVIESDDALKPTLTGKNEVSRFVNIAQGCDNFCTFCIVPFTRGREISRSPEAIITECKQLIAAGAKEISLLGQNVNSYGQDLIRDGQLASNSAFVELLDTVAQLPGLERLRFTTSNPHDFTRDLAHLFSKHKAMGNYMHLPVQSGDDAVLERMKRKVTVAEYLEKIAWLRELDPEFSISTDLIVGFPGETEEQFERTLQLVEKVRYSFVYCFAYSPRKNTAAARFKDQIDEETKKRRLLRLNQLQDQITLSLNQNEIGRTRDVLFLYESRKNPGAYYGRTPEFRLVKVMSNDDLIGQLLPVQIIDANKTALVGQLIV